MEGINLQIQLLKPTDLLICCNKKLLQIKQSLGTLIGQTMALSIKSKKDASLEKLQDIYDHQKYIYERKEKEILFKESCAKQNIKLQRIKYNRKLKNA